MPRKPKVTPDAAKRELMLRSPSYWRDNLIMRYDGETPIYWKSMMHDFQRKDFAAMDPAFMFVAGRSKEKGKHHKFWIQRSRGSNKSTDVASELAWTLFASRRAFSGILCAGDKDQASELRKRMVELLSNNPWMFDEGWLDIQRNCFIGLKTGARIDIMSADVKTSYGTTPEITICSEFGNWKPTLEEFYGATISSYAKREDAGGILVVETNAGSGKGYQWNAAETARTSEDYYYSAPYGWAPWYSQATIDGQKKQLSPKEFKRLWLNQWTESDDSFFTLEEADACIDPNLTKQDEGEPTFPYVAVLDVGLRNDRLVGTVMHQFNNEIVVDRMDVFDPEQFGGKIPIDIAEQWVRNTQAEFGGRQGSMVYFVIDPYQMVGTINKLQDEGYFIEEFEFAGGNANWAMGYTLQQLVLNRRIKWYKGCGEMFECTWEHSTKTLVQTDKVWTPFGDRDDFGTELAALEKVNMPSGKWRFNHTKGNHDDRTFTVAAGALFIVRNSRSAAFEDIIGESSRF